MTASNATLAVPAEVMHIGVWPSRDIRRSSRRWLPALLVSVCVNLLLLSLTPFLLQARNVSPEMAPIQVTLAPPPPAEIQQTVAPAPRSQPPRPKPRPKPTTPLPKPAPQPVAAAQPEPRPVEVAKPLAPPAPAIAEPAPAEAEPVSAPAPPPPPKAQPLFKLTRLPAFVEKHLPSYPESERASGREADVLAEVFIDHTGQVLDVTILNSAGLAFDQAVITALRESRFTPGYIDAEAVAVRFQIPFHFQLD